MTILFFVHQLGGKFTPAEARLACLPGIRNSLTAAVCGARYPRTGIGTWRPASSCDSVALGRTASASSKLFNTLIRPTTHYYLYYPTSPLVSFRMAVLVDVHELSARSLSSSLTPNATQRTTLIVAGCYIIIIGILWYALSLFLSLSYNTELAMNGLSQACAIFELH